MSNITRIYFYCQEKYSMFLDGQLTILENYSIITP
nr:MAG TPA: hypothetical protein [Caudoviricetes sp.]